MATFQKHCPGCGAANDPQVNYCHSCGRPLDDREWPSHKAGQRFEQRQVLQHEEVRSRRIKQRMSRRKMVISMSIVGGALLLPIGGATAYLIHQKLTDPHLLLYFFNGAVRAANWSPDGTRVAAVGWVASPAKWGTKALKVFDPLTGDTVVTGDTGSEVASGLAPLDVVWSADGQQLVTFIGLFGMALSAGSRIVEIVQVWDARTGQHVRSFPVTQPFIFPGYGSNGDNSSDVTVSRRALCDRYLAVQKMKAMNLNGRDGYYPILEIWDIATGSIIVTQDMPGAALINMQWAPDRRRLATLMADSSKNMHWEIWDIPTRQRVHSFPLIDPSVQPTLVWSPDGKSIAVGQDIYDVETGRKVMTYQIAGQQMLEVMAWSPDEKQVAVRSSIYLGGGWFRRTINPLFVLNASNGRKLTQYDDIGGNLIWSPNGAYFLAAKETIGTIDVWRMP